MMQCVRRCSFICGAVLSILLLLCSCQAGAGQLILPDNVPSENTSRGKEKLLAALNQEYFDRFKRSNYFIQGSDSAAEAVFLYLAQNSGGDIDKAVESLTENPKMAVRTAPTMFYANFSLAQQNLLGQLFLPLCQHAGERCPERKCRIWPRCQKSHRPSDASGVLLSFWQRKRRLCRRRHRRSGARRDSVRFLTTFFKTKNDRCGLLLRGGHFLCPPYWANHFILL